MVTVNILKTFTPSGGVPTQEANTDQRKKERKKLVHKLAKDSQFIVRHCLHDKTINAYKFILFKIHLVLLTIYIYNWNFNIIYILLLGGVIVAVIYYGPKR